jgi:DnaJ-class molecular chaperone
MRARRLRARAGRESREGSMVVRQTETIATVCPSCKGLGSVAGSLTADGVTVWHVCAMCQGNGNVGRLDAAPSQQSR